MVDGVTLVVPAVVVLAEFFEIVVVVSAVAVVVSVLAVDGEAILIVSVVVP